MQSNPALTDLIIDAIGPGFLDDPDRLAELKPLADDTSFQGRFATVKRANKVQLAGLIRDRVGVAVSPDALFDVHVKRIHEYKRQLLNILETVAVYNQIRAHPERPWVPRVKIFAGKAAASYWMAKLIIRLINDVARVINHDPTVRNLLKVVFLPNYNVSLAEAIVPAADLSEQISTAGMEASGTGNMKLALNGAITIGTLDGANVEIGEAVGADNIVIFGLTADEVEARRRAGHNPRAIIGSDDTLRFVLDAIADGTFSPDDRNRYRGLVDNLMTNDWFMVTADFASYCAAQRKRRRHVAEPVGPGGPRRSGTWPACRGSRPIAPSGNTPGTSGTSRRRRTPTGLEEPVSGGYLRRPSAATVDARGHRRDAFPIDVVRAADEGRGRVELAAQRRPASLSAG